ncbi:MAG: DNA polymerase III subunit gamma/tau, partial [Candidatus Latescibacterota bacterium]
MTKFLVSARKYRPQTFGELVSQDHVGETLRNAVKLDRLAHAYLFCGPRGVGKTSAARILAKTVNCLTPVEERENVDPCGTCDSCTAFSQGRSLDLIEIDAASNRGIDDVRALRDNVRIPPQVGQKKIYIIDEVHMMSKDAFNALLKTLEEPPPYVQFLFATTEPQKVIPTILSRCQRFDFRRISIQDIAERLEEICEKEGITADEASLRLIARKGDGAMRDAFSAFDQAVLLCGKNLEYEALVEAFGVVDVDVYFETADLIRTQNRAALLELVEKLVAKGYDLNEFLIGLTDHFRNLLVAVSTDSTDLIETDKETAQRYARQAEDFAESDLLRHLIVVDETQEMMRRSVNPRLRVELALLKMASLAKSADLESLIRKLGDAEPSGGEGRSAPETSTSASAPASASTPAAAPSAASASPRNSAPEEVSAQTSPSTGNPARTSATAPAPSVSAPSTTEVGKTQTSKAAQKPAPPPRTADADDKPGAVTGLFGKPAITGKKPKSRKAPETQRSDEIKPLAAVESLIPMDAVQTGWETYIKAVMRDRIHVGALLQHASPLAVVGKTVEIAVP